MSLSRVTVLSVCGSLLAAALSISTASAAISEQDTCLTKELGASGKDCKSLISCYGKAAKAGTAVDPECLSQASSKFADSLGKKRSA